MVSCAALAQMPVAYYPFNGNANDSTINAYHGSVTNAVLGIDRYSLPNRCYYFDGDGDYITVPQNFDFPEKTISLWFKAITIPTADKTIISCDNNSLTNSQFNIDVRNGNKLNVSVGNAGGSTTISTNTWYHVILVISSTQFKLILNGSVATLGSYAKYHSGDGQSGLNIATNRKRNSGFFNGAIDEIKIFNTALSDADAINLYTQYMAINDNKVQKPRILSNYVSDKIFIENPSEINIKAVINNLHGQQIVISNVSDEINISILNTGIYFIQLFDKNGVLISREKLVKL